MFFFKYVYVVYGQAYSHVSYYDTVMYVLRLRKK